MLEGRKNKRRNSSTAESWHPDAAMAQRAHDKAPACAAELLAWSGAQLPHSLHTMGQSPLSEHRKCYRELILSKMASVLKAM